MILKGLLENGAKLSYFRLDGFLARNGRYANRNLTPFHPNAPKRIRSPRSRKKRDESTVTENKLNSLVKVADDSLLIKKINISCI